MDWMDDLSITTQKLTLETRKMITWHWLTPVGKTSILVSIRATAPAALSVIISNLRTSSRLWNSWWTSKTFHIRSLWKLISFVILFSLVNIKVTFMLLLILRVNLKILPYPLPMKINICRYCVQFWKYQRYLLILLLILTLEALLWHELQYIFEILKQHCCNLIKIMNKQKMKAILVFINNLHLSCL